MKTRIEYADAAGKTVSGVARGVSSQVVIAFTDNTYITATIDSGWDDGDYFCNAYLDPDDFSDTDLIRLGFFTVEQLEARRAHTRLLQEARDRRQYEVLKNRFEGKS
jgi:hypothetical protein